MKLGSQSAVRPVTRLSHALLHFHRIDRSAAAPPPPTNSPIILQEMSSELLTSLVELGFESAKAERALKETQNRSVDAALDWLEKYGDNPPEEEKDDDVSMKEEGVHKTVPTSKNGEGPIMAKGLKCTECDKFFKNNALASYHSEKSGHVNFDEMEYEDKPLTEQEKQERLDRLRDQLKERQLAKQKIEIAENKGKLPVH
ncbi:hypothetical protein Pst134EA_017579 [Puccinia striiformis f. sp. tritici]|uniref:hypothetical protein n=1 Tax=Puccinia striiformis f. sp. tritici TaxID=168172 RepID=UPI00200753AB|nr:hypothetical protein Pst134EA_017579 [Puccinia striiformis f. sp. tritici]KAH9461272.1 hypothetical protein Pst134EA_017579 [Puccinia striiformis f. sp. tritici]